LGGNVTVTGTVVVDGILVVLVVVSGWVVVVVVGHGLSPFCSVTPT